MAGAQAANRLSEPLKEKAIGRGRFDPFGTEHWVELPVRCVAQRMNIGIEAVADLLPAPVDVTEDVDRVERRNDQGDEAERGGEADDREPFSGSVWACLESAVPPQVS